MLKYRKYTWQQFDKDAQRIAAMIRRKKLSFDGVWAPPRGGLPLAVVLSHALGMPFLKKPKSKKTLIVDDVADTGKTLKRFANTNVIATIFYHPESAFVPHIWIRKKGSGWILFPWEKSNSKAKKDNTKIL